MKAAAIALSFVLTSVGLSAQVEVQPGGASFGVATGRMVTSASPVKPWSTISGCPVSLRAQQISSADMMQVRKGQPQNSGQRLHLTLTDRDSKQIVAATVAVQGFTFTPRLMNTVLKPEKGSSQATRTIQVGFQAGTSVAADILVPGVSAAQTIDLVALTYADGTEWKLAEGQSCRITPDPLMLISATSR
jgi:hypothetical protein